MAQATPEELRRIRGLLAAVPRVPGQLERLKQIVESESGELSASTLTLLSQRNATLA